jgi:hypothetical protein
MLRLIIIAIVIILVLSFFGISLRHVISLPATQDNFHFVWQWLVTTYKLISAWIQREVDIAGAFLAQVVPFHFSK